MTNKIVSKDIPLAEITLRKYEKPYKTSKRDTVKKLCLSIGLLQPGDSREIITEYVKNKGFQDVMGDIIDNNFQREIKNGIKTVYPVTSLIIKSASRLQ